MFTFRAATRISTPVVRNSNDYNIPVVVGKETFRLHKDVRDNWYQNSLTPDEDRKHCNIVSTWEHKVTATSCLEKTSF